MSDGSAILGRLPILRAERHQFARSGLRSGRSDRRRGQIEKEIQEKEKENVWDVVLAQLLAI